MQNLQAQPVKSQCRWRENRFIKVFGAEQKLSNKRKVPIDHKNGLFCCKYQLARLDGRALCSLYVQMNCAECEKTLFNIQEYRLNVWILSWPPFCIISCWAKNNWKQSFIMCFFFSLSLYNVANFHNKGMVYPGRQLPARKGRSSYIV